MQDGCHIFGNGKSSKTTKKNQHHKFPSGLGYPKPEGKDEGESYTLFRTLPFRITRPNSGITDFCYGAGNVAGCKKAWAP